MKKFIIHFFVIFFFYIIGKFTNNTFFGGWMFGLLGFYVQKFIDEYDKKEVEASWESKFKDLERAYGIRLEISKEWEKLCRQLQNKYKN